jgi:ubiquinone/menaquinone biosynthesis C-methylase UbiE
MQTKQAYAQWASTYDSDRNRTRDLDEVVTRKLLSGLNFKSILEIGCGTGKNTLLFAQIGEHVRALDFSEEMIAQARRKSSTANVDFTVADITQRWPVDNASIDLISCNLVLEHVEDLSLAFSEAARVLIPGGRFLVSELHPVRQYLGVQAQFSRDEETTKIEAFIHDVTDFTSAARQHRLSLEALNEWRHEEDQNKPPRLISFMFKK